MHQFTEAELDEIEANQEAIERQRHRQLLKQLRAEFRQQSKRFKPLLADSELPIARPPCPRCGRSWQYQTNLN